jgi:uncharacterized coiled-coil DUF342 family protein
MLRVGDGRPDTGANIMASTALKEEVDTLRECMKELSYQAMRTDIAVARLAKEVRAQQADIRQFREGMRALRMRCASSRTKWSDSGARASGTANG